MKEPKEYKIETLQDIVNTVTVDNIDDYLADFRGFLLGYMSAKAISDMVYELSDKKPEPVPINSFKWIDDGKTNVTISIKPEDSEKNESIEIKLTDKDNEEN